MTALQIDSTQRSNLRKQTHHLKTVVMINDRSNAEAILPEIERQLQAHELIKIKISAKEHEDRMAWADRICETLECALVQHIGLTLYFYRPKTEVEASSDKRSSGRYSIASDEYIPKKLAAAGKTLKQFKKRKISNPSLNDSPRARYLDDFSTERAPRPTSHKKKKITSFAKPSGGSPNRRSAFSLKTNRRK